MKLSLVLCAAPGFGPASAQPAAPRPPAADAPPRDPHIVSPTASPDSKLTPDAPMLPYHLVQRAPLPVKTTLVSAVGLTPEGHQIFLTRNPAAMLLEFDKNDKFLRTFNPNIAIGPHGLRVDPHGNIWVTDSFLNVVWKLNAKGEPLMELGTRGEDKPWDDTKWNGAFNQPLDIAFDKDDNFYVIQGHGGTSNPLELLLLHDLCAGQARGAPRAPIRASSSSTRTAIISPAGRCPMPTAPIPPSTPSSSRPRARSGRQTASSN